MSEELENQKASTIIDYEDLRKFANEFLKMENPTKEVIRNLIDTITISKGKKVKIKYKFLKI